MCRANPTAVGLTVAVPENCASSVPADWLGGEDFETGQRPRIRNPRSLT